MPQGTFDVSATVDLFPFLMRHIMSPCRQVLVPFDACVKKFENGRGTGHNARGSQRNIDNWAVCSFLEPLYREEK